MLLGYDMLRGLAAPPALPQLACRTAAWKLQWHYVLCSGHTLAQHPDAVYTHHTHHYNHTHTCRCTTQTVRDVVERAGVSPNFLLLVGGFGSSAYLRHKLQSVFGTSMGELLSPPFAYSAVVEGAVRFLQSPATIVARVSSLTYCVQVGGRALARVAACVLGTGQGGRMCWGVRGEAVPLASSMGPAVPRNGWAA